VPTLTDGELVVRPFRDDDAGALAESIADPAAARWGVAPRGDALEVAIDRITRARADGAAGTRDFLAVELAGRWAGRVSLRYDGVGGAELGFETHPDLRGQHVALRASRLLCRFGFEDRGCQVIRWHAFVGNWASRRIAWRLGFKFEGESRLAIPADGTLQTAWGATLLAGEPMRPRRLWLTAPRLVGRSVVLRALHDDDVDRIVEGAGDPLSQRWLPFLPTPYTASDAAEFLETTRLDAANGTDLCWALADPLTDALTGCLGLNIDRPELGYWLHPDARGRGAATEAVDLAIRYAFSPALGLHRMTVRAAVENVASRLVAERVGMRLVGIGRADELLAAGPSDMALYDIVPSDLLPERFTKSPSAG
jgi:RimJ/RimL family protein N-acetyltransferase